MLKPWRLLPAYALNGIEVALGIGCIQWLATAWFGAHVATLVVSGAVCASIADLPNLPTRTWRRVGAAAVLSAVTALAMDLLRPWPIALGGAVMAVAFVAMMTLAWGQRAGAVSFAPILAMVFSMAVPPTGHPLASAGWSAAGSLAYLGWSLVANAVLLPRYRKLALTDALRAAADLFRARAAVLTAPPAASDDGTPMRAWISGESALAERLQAGRDMLFSAPERAEAQRDAAVLLRVIELRDALLASRLDAELLGRDAPAAEVLGRIAVALSAIGDALDAVATQVQLGSAGGAPAAPPMSFDGHFRGVAFEPGDARARWLPSLSMRLNQLSHDMERIRSLMAGTAENLPLNRAQLQRFVAPEGWPLRALRPHGGLGSPVMRHALRMSLALGGAYYLALALPWGSHPYWLVLSVAVVLRGNLGDTLARRNARVLGTVLGCLVVVGLSHAPSPGLLAAVFLVSLGTAHAFALQRYWLTATAASVMALLQSHMVNPGSEFAIVERLADTFLGAVIAWCFSYVLPSWERRGLRTNIGRALDSLGTYAARTLQTPAGDPVEERLARRQAYDALAALSSALERSRVEPAGVRLPVHALNAVLDHGERVLAHLSMLRLSLARLSGVEVSGALRAELQTTLGAATRALQALRDEAPRAPAPGIPVGPELSDFLPERAWELDVMPWLERRLVLLEKEMSLVHAAARAALA